MSEPQTQATSSSPSSVIEAHDVVKVYDDGMIRALDGVDLTVAGGEFVAITGPSGCGKSTLLHLLAALDRPTSGTIRVDGYDMNHLRHSNRFRRQEIGLIFQLHNLLPRLSVLGNVEIAMAGSHRPHAERSVYARRLLGDVDLAELADRRPTQLSGGERQRVAIARALANDPRILLADEPTGSLDSASVEVVLRLFQQLRDERGVTIVLVTHDNVVAGIADRIVRMLDGKVAADSAIDPGQDQDFRP